MNSTAHHNVLIFAQSDSSPFEWLHTRAASPSCQQAHPTSQTKIYHVHARGPYTLANNPMNKNCAMAITNRNCMRLDLLEWLIVATDEELDESGRRTYLSERSCTGESACVW